MSIFMSSLGFPWGQLITPPYRYSPGSLLPRLSTPLARYSPIHIKSLDNPVIVSLNEILFHPRPPPSCFVCQNDQWPSNGQSDLTPLLHHWSLSPLLDYWSLWPLLDHWSVGQCFTTITLAIGWPLVTLAIMTTGLFGHS